MMDQHNSEAPLDTERKNNKPNPHIDRMLGGLGLMSTGLSAVAAKIIGGTKPEEWSITNYHNYGVIGGWLATVGLFRTTTGINGYFEEKIDRHFDKKQALKTRQKAALNRPKLTELYPELMESDSA